MKNYNFFTFCENMDKITQELENRQKRQKIGEIVAALQQPMKDVLNLQIAKQIKDTENLINYVRGKNNMSTLRK